MLAQGEWSLLDPWFLGIVPLVWLAALWRWRRPRAAAAAASSALFDGLPRSMRARLVHLPLVLQVLGVTALAVALARPVTRDVLPIREQGVDILLVLDVSSSMRTDDMGDDGESLSRMTAAREKALEFAAARENDRVGLMTFSLFAELRCPLTLDKGAVAAFLRGTRAVEPNSEEDGTAIGGALASSVRFLEETAGDSKVVILLTDGQETAVRHLGDQAVTPADGAKLAMDAGIRVHTIGIGKGVPMSRLFGGMAMQPLDFAEIENVAEATGGQFFRAADEEALADVYRRIDELEKIELEDPRYRTTDGFAWPLLVGVSLMLLALALELFWIRGAP